VAVNLTCGDRKACAKREGVGAARDVPLAVARGSFYFCKKRFSATCWSKSVMTVAAGKSLAFERIGNCFLYMSSKRPPLDSDWAQYIDWLKSTLRPGMSITSVVYERAGGPNAAQRKLLTDVTAPVNLKVAVITPSTIARGAVTAMSWFKPGYKAFTPEETDAAVAFLDLKGNDAVSVKQAIQRLLLFSDST
jgi:hypothetical protein